MIILTDCFVYFKATEKSDRKQKNKKEKVNREKIKKEEAQKSLKRKSDGNESQELANKKHRKGQ